MYGIYTIDRASLKIEIVMRIRINNNWVGEGSKEDSGSCEVIELKENKI
jgi:hypothetical protein